MYSLVFVGFLAFLLSLVLTPLVRNISCRLGVFDQPDKGRKLHSRPIPRVGGIAICLSYTLAFGALLLTKLNGAVLIRDALPFVWKLLPGAGLIFLTGLLDDLFRLKPWQKLVGQTSAAAAAYIAGIHVNAVGGQSLGHLWSFPITLLWFVACMNALNLIDGVDGLAAGIGLFATITSFLTACMQQNVELALATLPLAGCLIGFLGYNFNPATIFLGDCGSLFIGFLLGCYGVLWSQKSATILGMTAPLMALSIPLLDTSLAIARRFLRRQPIFGADRGHIHHRLLDRGFSPRKVALLLYALCALAAIFSLSMVNKHFELAILVIFCAGILIGIRRLNYIEFDTAWRMLSHGAFRHLLNSQISLDKFESHLSLARTPDECWRVLEENSKEFGFHHIEMRLAGRNYTNNGDQQAFFGSWRLEIPLSECDKVHLMRKSAPNTHLDVVGPFAEILRKTLQVKLTHFDISTPVSGSGLQGTEALPGHWHVASVGRP